MEFETGNLKSEREECGYVHLVQVRRLAFNIPATAFCWANAAEFTAFFEQTNLFFDGS